MEQQTITIKIFLRIICPDIHLRRMTYPPERKGVRSHLLANNIVNKESFDDYMSELV